MRNTQRDGWANGVLDEGNYFLAAFSLSIRKAILASNKINILSFIDVPK